MPDGNGNRSGELQALTVFDYSDRELLLIVMEICAANDGYAYTEDIAEALGIKSKHPKSSVGSRLAVLRRIGAIDKDPESRTLSRWTVTPVGEMVANGKLKASTERTLEALDEGQLMLLARHLGRRQRAANMTAGQLLRREWMTSTGLKR
jgi:hypothetical protein